MAGAAAGRKRPIRGGNRTPRPQKCALGFVVRRSDGDYESVLGLAQEQRRRRRRGGGGCRLLQDIESIFFFSFQNKK